MPVRQQIDRWKVIAGYIVYSIAIFAFLLYLTFPYDAVEKRLSAEASDQGFYVKFGGLGPGLLGISASNVQISKKVEVGDEGAPVPIVVRSFAIRPSLFPAGVGFRGKVFGGTVTGAVGGMTDVALRVNLDDLNAADPNLKTFSGLDLSGKIQGHLSLDIPRAPSTPAAKSREPDLSQAKGTVSLSLEQLTVNGGTLKLPVMGEMTPVDLPRVALGDLEAKISFDKGMGKIDKFQAKGADLDVSATGTIKLSKRLEYSEPNINLKLKADPEFTKRLGLIGSGLATLPADKEDPSFRTAKLTGFLGRPAFNFGR